MRRRTVRIIDAIAQDKMEELSDGYAAAKRMYLELDGVPAEPEEPDEMCRRLNIGMEEGEALREAERGLADLGFRRLIPILELIVLNGEFRNDSIAQLARITNRKYATARRRYFRGRSLLLKLFSPSRIKGGTHVEAT